MHSSKYGYKNSRQTCQCSDRINAVSIGIFTNMLLGYMMRPNDIQTNRGDITVQHGFI